MFPGALDDEFVHAKGRIAFKPEIFKDGAGEADKASFTKRAYLNFFRFSDTNSNKKTIAGHGKHNGVDRDNRESGVNPEQSCCRDDGVFQVR